MGRICVGNGTVIKGRTQQTSITTNQLGNAHCTNDNLCDLSRSVHRRWSCSWRDFRQYPTHQCCGCRAIPSAECKSRDLSNRCDRLCQLNWLHFRELSITMRGSGFCRKVYDSLPLRLRNCSPAYLVRYIEARVTLSGDHRCGALFCRILPSLNHSRWHAAACCHR